MTEDELKLLLKRNPAIKVKGKTPAVRKTRSKKPYTFGTNEHELQALFFKVLDANSGKYPFLDFIFAVPNGGDRHKLTAIKLKREGVKSGVPDIFVPFSRHGFSGMWIEHKFGYNKLSDPQKKYKRHLQDENYKYVTSYSEIDSIRHVEEYLGIKLLA